MGGKSGLNEEPIDLKSPKSPTQAVEWLENGYEDLRETGSRSAAWAMAVVQIPVIAALLSVTIYVIMMQSQWVESQWSKLIAISVGLLLALLVWFIAAICSFRSTAVDRANMSSYQMIINRLYQLAAWIEDLECEQQGNSQGLSSGVKMPSCMCTISKKEICATFDAICSRLKKKDNSSWMWANGYVNVWRLIHRIDEALIEIIPAEEVIRDALHDEMSIVGSKIDNRDDLLNKLRLAVKTFDEQAAVYLHQQPPEQGSSADHVHRLLKGRKTGPVEQQSQYQSANQGNHKEKPAAPFESQARARAIIREVRFSLHQFRDDRWEKLIRVRNHLMRITLLTGFALYLLVAFAIVLPEEQLSVLETATVFYFVGAIVSLFGRLYDQSKTDSSIDDFRLATARLMAAPVFSGLAAVGGVLIVMKLGIIPGADIPSSGKFELNLANIIVAAVFGLTPSLFVNTFQKQADQYKADLKSSQAPTGEQEKVLST